MSEFQETNSAQMDNCDKRCNAEGMVWIETEHSAILLCGHHIRALFIDPKTKRLGVIDVEAYWKHTGMPFDALSFWEPVAEVEEVEDEESEEEESEQEEDET